MKNIAILLTCFNRKQKTITCLTWLQKAMEKVQAEINFETYLTDDGSTDGTGDAVKSMFPKVNVLQGDGNLYWAGGMRKSWDVASKQHYDGYLLLNDDTLIFEDIFVQISRANDFSITNYGKTGIYLGSTADPETKKMTYGGAKLTNKFLFKYHLLPPNGKHQSCELGNANIMYVSKNVVDRIGILSKDFIHGVADYDYTLQAVKYNLPVILLPKFLGYCEHDHKDIYDDYHKKTLKERWKLLHSPLGLDFKSNLNLMKRHFPLRIPFVILSAALKVFLPSLYHNARKHR